MTFMNITGMKLSVTSRPPYQVGKSIEAKASKKQVFVFLLLDYSIEERTKRLTPDHVRLCAAKESLVYAKDAFRGRFSEGATFIPRTFRVVSYLKGNKTSQAASGRHCLGIMDCLATKETKYFMVYHPAKRRGNGRCHACRIAKVNGVPVECSCMWPRLFGDDPSVLLHRRHN